jgi:hypothetical protein
MKKHLLFALVTSLTMHANGTGQPKNDEPVMTPEKLNETIKKITSSKPYEKILFKDKAGAIWLPVDLKEASGTLARKWITLQDGIYRIEETDPNNPDRSGIFAKDMPEKLSNDSLFYLPNPNKTRLRLAKYLTLTLGGVAGVWTFFKKQKEKLAKLEARLNNEPDNKNLIAEHAKQKKLVKRIKAAAIIASTAGALFFIYQEPWHHKGFERHNRVRSWTSPEAYLKASSAHRFSDAN